MLRGVGDYLHARLVERLLAGVVDVLGEPADQHRTRLVVRVQPGAQATRHRRRVDRRQQGAAHECDGAHERRRQPIGHHGEG